jgi:hypothetical protein
MATKAQVLSKAKSVGAEVELTQYDIVISMPQGKVMDNKHYSAFDFNAFEYKSDVWAMLLDELRLIKDCDCGCANLD